MQVRPRHFVFAGLLLLAVSIALPLVVRVPDTLLGVLYGLAFASLFAGVLRRWLPEPCDAAPPALHRRYIREFSWAMAGYMVLLFLSMWLLKRVEEPTLRALVALLPAVPIALVLRAIIRYIRDADELQRRIELESVSFATALVSMLYMSGGQFNVPIVFRGPNGSAFQVSSQHSHALEAMYANFPGLKVVMPSTAADAKGLLKSSIRDNNPVIFMEQERMYGIKGEVPEDGDGPDRAESRRPAPSPARGRTAARRCPAAA